MAGYAFIRRGQNALGIANFVVCPTGYDGEILHPNRSAHTAQRPSCSQTISDSFAI